jgi:hypothetical protein
MLFGAQKKQRNYYMQISEKKFGSYIYVEYFTVDEYVLLADKAGADRISRAVHSLPSVRKNMKREKRKIERNVREKR